MKRGYSYVRFSTPEQAQGKSLERQSEAARTWCKQNNVELDTELNLKDLGVSAFRGKNSDTGALGAFLKAVHIGQVPKGSFLLIETFDRLSRESSYDAQLVLQNLINQGITVVTLLDGKQYNVSILRADPLALIYAILLMSRSHEESATKSKRLADVWRRKREDLKGGALLTSTTPGWIKIEKETPKLIPERAKVVRRIFRELLEGAGKTTIAGLLNKERVPTFGGGRCWTSTYVRLILSNRSVLGEFQPHRIEHGTDRKRVRVPEGAPLKNYWPAVVDAKTFNKAQLLLKKTYRHYHAKPATLRNILAGLARCPDCDSLMDRVVVCQSANNQQHPRLCCSKARRANGCTFRSVSLAIVESALSTKATTLVADVPNTSADLSAQIAALESELVTVQRRIEDMMLLLADTPSKTVAGRIQNDEAECTRLQEEISRLRSQLQFGGARRIRDAVSRMQSALQWHATDPSDVVGTNAALRECFEKIIVNIPKRQLEMHWRHGHLSLVGF